MSQVSIIQYAEISTGSGQPLRIGSKVIPSTITLTGTGEVYHRVYNDITALSTTVLYDGDLTGLKWFAVKPSTEIQLAFGDEVADPIITSGIVLAANVWQFFNSGVTLSYTLDDTIAFRAIQSQANITKISAYNVLSADIEFIGAY